MRTITSCLVRSLFCVPRRGSDSGDTGRSGCRSPAPVLISGCFAVALAATACSGVSSPRADVEMTTEGGTIQEASPQPPPTQPDTQQTAMSDSVEPAAPDATAATADSVAAETEHNTAHNAAAEAVGWPDLQSLALSIGGEAIQFAQGHGVVTYDDPYGGWSERYELRETVGRGDLNNDGRDDLVALVEHRPGGSGIFSYLVPVLDDNGTAAAREAVFLGDRIVVEDISVHDGRIEVAMLDRGPGDSYIVLSQRKTLAIDLSASPPAVTELGIVPLPDGLQYVP